MNTIKTLVLVGLISSTGSLMVACSDKEDRNKESTGDHVWKSKTDTIQTSKDAAKKLQEQLNLQQQKLDETN